MPPNRYLISFEQPFSGNTLWLAIDGQHFKCLIDTGVSNYIMRHDVCRELRKVASPHKEQLLRSADGGFLPTVGQCASRTCVAGRILSVEFIVLSSCFHKVTIG